MADESGLRRVKRRPPKIISVAQGALPIFLGSGAAFRKFAYLGAGFAGGLGQGEQIRHVVAAAVLPFLAVLIADCGSGRGIEVAAAALVAPDGDFDIAYPCGCLGP